MDDGEGEEEEEGEVEEEEEEEEEEDDDDPVNTLAGSTAVPAPPELSIPPLLPPSNDSTASILRAAMSVRETGP